MIIESSIMTSFLLSLLSSALHSSKVVPEMAYSINRNNKKIPENPQYSSMKAFPLTGLKESPGITYAWKLENTSN